MRAPIGLSSQAIAGNGNHHPWDPSDLRRCMNYCEGHLTTDQLRVRMAGRSVEWDRLLVEWDSLTELLRHEMDTRTDGNAPLTYRAMKRVLAGGVKCVTCDGSGRSTDCEKCKGTGRRSGGRCRAGCYLGALQCGRCDGLGYTNRKDATGA